MSQNQVAIDTQPSVADVAKTLFESFDANERHGVRFGIFPFKKMESPIAKTVDRHTLVVEMMRLTR